MKIIQEEFSCEKAAIQLLENLIDTTLPLDYAGFLLQYNGGIPYPYYPYSSLDNKWFMGVDRFLSCGDLQLQKTKLLEYDDIDLIKEHDVSRFDLNVDEFLIIGLCQKGNLLMYMGEEEKGQIYFSRYLDGEGLTKSPFASFSELIGSLKENDWDDIDFEDYYYKSNKIFQERLFQIKGTSIVNWSRFKSVLKFYGDPSHVHKHEQKSVYQKYEWNAELIKRIGTISESR